MGPSLAPGAICQRYPRWQERPFLVRSSAQVAAPLPWHPPSPAACHLQPLNFLQVWCALMVNVVFCAQKNNVKDFHGESGFLLYPQKGLPIPTSYPWGFRGGLRFSFQNLSDSDGSLSQRRQMERKKKAWDGGVQTPPADSHFCLQPKDRNWLYRLLRHGLYILECFYVNVQNLGISVDLLLITCSCSLNDHSYKSYELEELLRGHTTM